MVKSARWFNSMKIRKQILDEIKEELFKKEFGKALTESYKSPKKSKRSRSAFTTEQIEFLEKEFHRNSYLERDRRRTISETILLPERAIKIWFQNRRMKEKNRHQEEYSNHQGFNEGQRCVKQYVNDNELINVIDMPSVNERPLPTLDSSGESVSMQIDMSNRDETVYSNQPFSEANYVQFYKENLVTNSNVQHHLIITRVPSYEAAENRSRPSSPYLSAEYSIELLKKYNVGRNNNVVEQHNSPAGAKQEYNQAGSSQDEVPQDLSINNRRSTLVAPYEDRQRARSYYNPHNRNPEPVRSYNYSQPFIRPDHFLWRPIQVPATETQISSPHSPRMFPRSSPSETNCKSSSCRCECNIKGCGSGPIVYELPNSSVQYVLSPVPMQGMGKPYTD